MQFKNLTILILLIPLITFIYLFSKNLNTWDTQFTTQTKNFLNGRLDISNFTPSLVKHDTVFLNDQFYWPQGPFPSILLMPFILIPGITQVHLQFILIFITAVFLYKAAVLKGFKKESSIFLTAAFLFASPVFGIITDPNSWFYAQVVTIFLSILLIYEMETKQRMFLMGFLCGAILATRPTAAFIILPIIYLIYKKAKKQKTLSPVFFLSPIIISILLLMIFNQARFSNPIDNGYFTNHLGYELSPVRDLGVFSLVHIPTNIYYYFLISIEPITKGNYNLITPFFTYSRWGLSFFIVAPFFAFFGFLALFKKDSYLKMLWISIFLTLFALLCYFAPGMRQFGPRYTADFLPILFLILLLTLNKPSLTSRQKTIIVLSCILNSYLLLTPFLVKN